MNIIRPSTRDAIISAAFDLYAKDPAASLGDIARRAGVGRATLHRQFPSRTHLIRTLAQIAQAELDEAVENATKGTNDLAEAFRLSIVAIVPLANRQLFLANENLEQDPDLATAYAASRNDLILSIEEAKAQGLFGPGMPTPWIALAYENLIYAAWSMVQKGEATPKHAAEFAWRTFMLGMKDDNK